MAQPIPGSAEHITRFDTGIGLAFDPVDNGKENTIIKFDIVKAVGCRTSQDNGTKFCFAIFSSYTGRWTMSSTTLSMGTKIIFVNKKVAYGSGIMYWDYDQLVLWFDIATAVAGLQPERLTERRLIRPIGVKDGRFVYIGVRHKLKTNDRILCYNMVTGKT
uniref:Uncharacterized protein n=1 Tax=Leersia perrieri TaxID=77586 RepID=A0A0D9XYF1_9ORYZ